MNQSTQSVTQTVAQKIGASISISRRARRWKQKDLAEMSGIGMNTMVAIEKGVSTVQLGLYLQVLSTLGITDILSPVANMTGDAVGIQSMSELLPKRVSGKRR